MRVLSLFFLKGQLRFSVLEGTKAKPILVDKGRIVPLETADIACLMNWHESNFEALVSKYNPTEIVFRYVLDPDKEQLIHSEFPVGVVHLLCYKKGLPISGYVQQSLVPSKLGLPTGTDLFVYCDTVFGAHPPYWDKNQKTSILTAWLRLP